MAKRIVRVKQSVTIVKIINLHSWSV